jgi:hypothetical protein
MVVAPGRPDPEQHGPRAPIGELDEIRVSGGLDRMAWTFTMRDQRAVW